tara:strand:- start:287 stop:388 length:102 start_codon:yes stop_codon:yes gene_type:complete
MAGAAMPKVAMQTTPTAASFVLKKRSKILNNSD